MKLTMVGAGRVGTTTVFELQREGGFQEIVLLDISPRIIAHVTQARARASRNIGYTVNLPLPRSSAWLPETRAYWQTFGD